MKNKHRYKGFTIVELIVVMAIIGILVLIATPTFGKYMDDAKEVDRQALVKTAYTATVAYASRNPLPPEGYVNPSPGMIAEYINSDVKIVSGKAEDPTTLYPSYVNKYGHFEWSRYTGTDKEELMCVHIIPKGNTYAGAGITQPAPNNTIIIEMYDPSIERQFNNRSEFNIKYYMFEY